MQTQNLNWQQCSTEASYDCYFIPFLSCALEALIIYIESLESQRWDYEKLAALYTQVNIGKYILKQVM